MLDGFFPKVEGEEPAASISDLLCDFETFANYAGVEHEIQNSLRGRQKNQHFRLRMTRAAWEASRKMWRAEAFGAAAAQRGSMGPQFVFGLLVL